MAAGNLSTGKGTLIYVSADAPTNDGAAYLDYAGVTWTLVGHVDSDGVEDFGGSSGEETFTDLGSGIIKTYAGAEDLGAFAFQCAYDKTDAGQNLVRQYAGTNTGVSAKVVLPAGEEFVSHGISLVNTKQVGMGVTRNTVRIKLNAPVVEN